MKILQITNSFYPVLGGQEKVVLEIAKGLVGMGHEVTVLTTDYMCKVRPIKKEKIDGINIVRLKNKYWLSGYGYSPLAISWLKKNYSDFDIIHCHGYNRYLPEFALKFLNNRKPTVFSPHGFVHTKKNNFAKTIHRLTIGRILNKASVCTALMKLDFLEYKKLGVKKNNIVEIPNGVDIEKFNEPSNKYLVEFKQKFNLTKRTLLYVGRIHKSKGLQYVIEAIKNLDCQLLIVGPDGEYLDELKSKIKKLGIGNKIIFAGKVSDTDLINSYFSSDLFILFSEWEGFGIVAIEAMAAGLPVISSDRGALPYIIKNGFNGKIIEFRNVNKLKNEINYLITNNKDRLKLGKNAKRFSKNYSWKEIIYTYENLYKKLIKEDHDKKAK